MAIKAITFSGRFASVGSILILAVLLLLAIESTFADILRPASLLRVPQRDVNSTEPLGVYRGFDLDAIAAFQRRIAPARIYWDIFRPFVGADFLDYHPASDELTVRIWWRAGRDASPVYAPGVHRIPAKGTTLDINLDSIADLRFLLSDVDRSAGPVGSPEWQEAMNGLLDPNGLYLGKSRKPNTLWKGLIHNFVYGPRASEINIMQGYIPYGTAMDWRNSPSWVQGSGHWLRSLAMHNLRSNSAFVEAGIEAASYISGLVRVVDKVPGVQACESKVPDSVYSANALLCLGYWMRRDLIRAVAAVANDEATWLRDQTAFPMWPALGAANFQERLNAAKQSLSELLDPAVRQKVDLAIQGLTQTYAAEERSRKQTPLSNMDWPNDPTALRQYIDQKMASIGALPNTTTPGLDMAGLQAASQPILNRIQQLNTKRSDFGLTESEEQEARQLVDKLVGLQKAFLPRLYAPVQPIAPPERYEIFPRAFYSMSESIELSELASIAMRIIRADPAYVAWGSKSISPGGIRYGSASTEQLVVELIRLSGPRWDRDTIIPNYQLADRRMMGDAALGLGLRQPVGSLTPLQLEALQTLRHLADPDLDHPFLKRSGVQTAVARGAEALRKLPYILGQKSNPNFVRLLMALGPKNVLLADQYRDRGIYAVHGDHAWLATTYLMAIWYLGTDEGPGAEIGTVISDFLISELGDEQTTVSEKLRSLGALGGVTSPQDPSEAIAGFNSAVEEGRAAAKGDLSTFIELIMTRTAAALSSMAAADEAKAKDA